MNGNGKANGGATAFRGTRPGREAEEGFVPRKVAPWPWATTSWNWSEKRDQFEAKRLQKSQIP